MALAQRRTESIETAPESGPAPPSAEIGRSPWLAGAMSAMLPGLGQLYVGEANRALWCFLVFAAISVPGMTLAVLHLPPWATLPAMLASVALAVGTWLYSIVDAVRRARRERRAFRPRPWQTAGLYVAVFAACNLILLPLLFEHVRQHRVQAFRIPSDSMSPSLLRGDYLFADMRYNCPSCRAGVERGDLAVFVYPNDRTIYHIKRVIGLPDDRIEIAGAAVSVNGQPLAVPGTNADDAASGTRREGVGGRTWRVAADADASLALELTVPTGHVFVLGDNRADSLDSRDYGSVPLTDVVGRARQLWLSHGEEGIRWDRLGRVLR